MPPAHKVHRRLLVKSPGELKEQITEVDLLDAIVPEKMPKQSMWPTRDSYIDWLRTGSRQQHVQQGVSLANQFLSHATSPGGLGLSLRDAYNLLMNDPTYLMTITRLPITFIPQYRFGLIKAGSEMWDRIEQDGGAASFSDIHVDRKVFSYAVAKMYSKTRADGSIAAGASLEKDYSYGLFGWARDAGLVSAVGLKMAYQNHNAMLTKITERQVRWFVENQGGDGKFSQRIAINTSVFDTEEERRRKSRMWADPQMDGTSAVVTALADYVKLATYGGRQASGSNLVQAAYKSIAKAVDYLARGDSMTWCAWEERYDRLFHSDAHIIKALRRVSPLQAPADRHSLALTLIRNGAMVNVSRINSKANQLADGLKDYLNITDGDRRDLERFLGRPLRGDELWIKEGKSAPGWHYVGGQDHGPINSTAIEAVVETGVLPLSHPSVLSHILLMDELSAKAAPKVNNIDDPQRKHHVMWIRYPGDQFDPEIEHQKKGETHGHLWSICTMWAAQHAYKLAHDYLNDGRMVLEHTKQFDFINRALELVNKGPMEKPAAGADGLLEKPVTIERNKEPELFDSIVSGIWGWGDKRFSEITSRFNPAASGENYADYRISEQYHTETGKPYGEKSLTWAYREFIQAIQYRADLLQDWLKKPKSG